MKQSAQKPGPAAPKTREDRLADTIATLNAGLMTPAEAFAAVMGPAASDHVKSLTLAAFTPLELDTLRNVCRDSDNELGIRALNAALARGGK